MKPFQYATATSVESAVDLVSNNGRYFAGGIDVLGELKDGLSEPDLLVNVKELPGTQAITPGDGRWTVGANVKVADLASDAELGKTFPGLAEAALEVASPQIRNVATLGGNLAQHSRCWYYRHRDIQCLKGGGDTCYARVGKNRHHSIFSGNPCISPVVSNLSVMLAALDATAHVFRRGETRALSIDELYEMAWMNPLAHHSLGPRDLIVSVEIPTTANRSAYIQVSDKSSFDWALVSCAAAARVQDGVLSEARVVLGAVAPIPYQREEANALLNGQRLTPELAARVADQLLEEAEPFADNGYKVPMAKALVQRTLMRLVA